MREGPHPGRTGAGDVTILGVLNVANEQSTACGCPAVRSASRALASLCMFIILHEMLDVVLGKQFKIMLSSCTFFCISYDMTSYTKQFYFTDYKYFHDFVDTGFGVL